MPVQKISKEELLLKSITVFRQKGYYRTNMSDLAQYCGLTKGAFYHHFKSKEEVMLKSLEMTSLWFKKHIFSIADNPDIPEDKKLETLLERYFKTFTHKKGGCFFANTVLETAQVEETFKATLIDFFQSFEEALQKIFLAKYSEAEAKEKSVKVITDLEGSIMLMQLHDKVSYLQDAVERSVSLY